MHSLRQRFTHVWPAILFAAAYILSQSQIAQILREGNAEELLIQFQLMYSLAEFQQLLSSVSAEQLAALQAHFAYDWIHPLWYGGMFFTLTAWQLNRKHFPAKASKLLWLVPLMALMDVIENTLHKPLFIDPALLDASGAGIAVAVAATCASAKWLLALYFVVLNLVLAFAKPRQQAQPETETKTETQTETKPKPDTNPAADQSEPPAQ